VITWIGPLIVATGVLHMVVGVLLFRAPLAAIFRDGFVGSVGRDPTRGLAFWFMLFGPVLAAIGWIVQHALAVGDGAVLTVVGWTLLVTGVIGAAAIPVSGFWIVIVLSLSLPLLLR